MNSPLHLKNRVKSAGHRTVSGWSLTTPYGARPGIGWCYHIRRRPAPVRYVTTQEKILKNRPVPGRLSNSPVMCKSVKSYNVSFICGHSIICLFCVLTFRLMNLRLFLALFVIVFMWDDQLRLLLILTPIYFAFSVVLIVVSWVWEDNRFLFSVYSKN